MYSHFILSCNSKNLFLNLLFIIVFLNFFIFSLFMTIWTFEYNSLNLDIYSYDIFYIHVSSAIFCQVFFWIILTFTLFLVSGLSSFYLFIYRHSLIFACLVCCVISIITGEFWSISTWGTWAPFDSRFVSLFVLFITYCFIYFLTSLSVFSGYRNYLSISNWLCIFMSFNYPFIKYSVTWWNSLHMSSSFKVYYDLNLEQNYDIFFCSLLYFLLFFLTISFYHFRLSLLSLKFFNYTNFRY